MAYFPQFPPQAFYPCPMPFPNQDAMYAMYPPNGAPIPTPDGAAPVYYDQQAMDMHPHHHHPHHPIPHHHMSGPPATRHYGKVGFANRKDSADSGISDFSSASSRKASSVSTVSNVSSILEESSLDDVKEESSAPYEEPDDDLCEKIVQQVEFYFSDANITKDKFLLKHVKRNKEGFVSLKLISSFKRVKHLTKDWRQVAEAIERKSDKLEVNDVKTKVRRLATLPEYDETTPSRTVVALNLPLERPTIEGVAEIFSECGEIVLIRILRPGNPVPADVKPFANKHPEMTDKTCALVEFERTEFAHKAVRELNDDEKEEGLKVMEMTAPPPKTTKSKEDKKKAQQLQQLQQHAHQQLLFKQQQGVFQQSLAGQQQRRFSHAGFNIPPHHPQSSEQMMLAPHQQPHQPPRRRISLYHNMKFTPIAEEQQHKEQQHSLNPNAPTFQMQQQQQLPPRRISRPHLHPAAAASMEAAAHAAAMQHQAAAAAAAAAAIMHGQPPVPAHHQPSPWMMRRLSGMHAPDFASASGLTLPPNVIRLPRGPDKGKGFQKWCRSRMEPAAQAAASLPQKKKSHAVPIVAPPAEEEEKPQPENVEGAAAVDKKEDEAAKEEAAPAVAAAAVGAPEPEVDGAAALPAPAPAAAAADADLVLANDSCSDSGNEDGSVSSEPDVEAADNERSR